MWNSVSAWRHIEGRIRRETMQSLCECGWLRAQHGGYAVNPAVHEVYAAQADIELERRQKYAAVLDEKLGRVRTREPGEE